MSRFDSAFADRGLPVLSEHFGREITLRGDLVDDLTITAISISEITGTEADREVGRDSQASRLVSVRTAYVVAPGDWKEVVIDEEVWRIKQPPETQTACVITWRAVRHGAAERSRPQYRGR